MLSATTTPSTPGGHVALVTGANHGIGAATVKALAASGAGVLVTFLRVDDPEDSGVPETYRRHRASDAGAVIDAIRAAGGRAVAVEADLAEADTPARLFDLAEAELGPVDILVNNATGWVADTFVDRDRDARGFRLAPVSAHHRQRAAPALIPSSPKHLRGDCVSMPVKESNSETPLLQGTVDVLILKTLSREPMHGYAVSAWVRERTDGELGLEEAALYQALHRLERRGWVEAEWGLSENNRRAKFYRLTAKGRKRLTEASSAWRRYAAAVARVLEAP